MPVSYLNQRLQNTPLSDLFEKLYSVGDLWNFMQELGYPSLQKAVPAKRPKKAVMAEQIKALLASETSVERMFATMNPKLRAVMDILVWSGSRQLPALEKELGFELTIKAKVESRYSLSKETEHQEMPWLHLVVFQEEYLYSKGLKITVSLPSALSRALKKHMPKPLGYNVQPLDTLSQSGLMYFRCDDELVEDLRIVADYIARGHLQHNNNSTIKKNCIRTVANLTTGGEFYPGEKLSTKLPLLRHEILLNLIAMCGPKLREQMLSDPPYPDRLLRPLCDALFNNPECLHNIVMRHIKTQYYVGSDGYRQQAAATLRNLFAILPEEQWVLGNNLEKIVDYRDLNINPIASDSYVTIDRASSCYNYSNRAEINHESESTLLTIPLLQGMCFLFSALGWAEIAYGLPPEHAMWQLPSERFLTPYDGLHAVRLTPAGAYALRLRDELEFKRSARTNAEIILNPQRLTATCRHIDPVTEMSLLQFMEKVSEGCYRMTRQSLVRGCETKKGVEQRVADFKRHIASDLPPFWDNFFKHVLQTAVALSTEADYKVYDLADSPELRRLFMSDAVLRDKTLKVERIRVAVKNADQSAVRKRLSAFGYLIN